MLVGRGPGGAAGGKDRDVERATERATRERATRRGHTGGSVCACQPPPSQLAAKARDTSVKVPAASRLGGTVKPGAIVLRADRHIRLCLCVRAARTKRVPLRRVLRRVMPISRRVGDVRKSEAIPAQ